MDAASLVRAGRVTDGHVGGAVWTCRWRGRCISTARTCAMVGEVEGFVVGDVGGKLGSRNMVSGSRGGGDVEGGVWGGVGGLA